MSWIINKAFGIVSLHEITDIFLKKILKKFKQGISVVTWVHLTIADLNVLIEFLQHVLILHKTDLLYMKKSQQKLCEMVSCSYESKCLYYEIK